MSEWSKFLEGTSLLDVATSKERFIRKIMQYAPKGSKLLETGFGSGKMSMLLLELGFKVTAIDIDEEIVNGKSGEVAKRFGVDVRKMDMTKTTFQDRSFDVVFHQGVLEHFEDHLIIEALKEAGRIGNLVIFHVPSHRYPGQPFGNERLLKIRYWKELIRRSGLSIIELIGDNPNPIFHFFLPHVFYTRTFAEKIYNLPSKLLCRSNIFVLKRWGNEIC